MGGRSVSVRLGATACFLLAAAGAVLLPDCSDSGSSNTDDGGSSSGDGGSSSGAGGSSSGDGGSSSGGTSTADWSESERSGIATYYDADGSGACSFQPSPDDLNVAALNSEQWSGAAWCGACADVQGPNGSIRVRIVDLCPECNAGHLDLSQQAFAQIAEVSAGRVDITWNFVACTVQGPVRYRFKDGTNQWWAAILVENHALPITSLEWSLDGGSWQQADRQDYNYFVVSSGLGTGPVSVRITAIDGQQLEDDLPVVEEYLVVDGRAQFQ